ncbi:hypothetical protein [Methylobacterium gossipiicola]|uniref:Uncharacterized protein n=1 Tax=Methylobacterium gossipiicola TaxID=582675 RepID=A0A1I2VUE2_9HYPH|nr:hypothetical protein [Methylobacterium gossipiicola]SFG92752.1 hypothetical protein SAMN05192565_11787 [Methylobacterium gossipiicola]
MTTDIRSQLARQLLEKIAAAQAQNDEIDALKTRLRELGVAGSFTERFPDLGTVEVKAAKAASFKGLMPTLVPELFLAMTEAERTALQESGVVTMSEQWGNPFHGSITPKLLAASA